PVIYFYADREFNVDVDVQFPNGFVTEWFPQVARIGPAKLIESSPRTAADWISGDSRVQWNGVRVRPPGTHPETGSTLPVDKTGSHYYAARETDAAFLAVNAEGAPEPEREKFLFYRGAGNFATPLVVTMSSDTTVTLSNAGPSALSHLFALNVRNGKAEAVVLDTLPPGARRSFSFVAVEPPTPQDLVMPVLEREVAAGLASEGLYAREAEAMVH